MECIESDALHKYFAIVWTATFFSLYRIDRMKQTLVDAAYDKAVVQAFVGTLRTFSCLDNSHGLLKTDRRIEQL